MFAIRNGNDVERVLDEIFDLYEKHGMERYLIDGMTKMEHMTQCAMLAEQEGFSDEVILATFFHDIGLLIKGGRTAPCHEFALPYVTESQLQISLRHGIVGADFLEARGFPTSFTNLLRNHVEGVRLLAFLDPTYVSETLPINRRMIKELGGAMSCGEALHFVTNHGGDVISLLSWDEMGKNSVTAPVKPLSYYKNMCRQFLNKLHSH